MAELILKLWMSGAIWRSDRIKAI